MPLWEIDMEKHDTSSDPGMRPEKTAETAFRWEYPERVRACGGVTPANLSRMILDEARRRFPAVVEYLAGAEREREFGLTICTSPAECTLALRAGEMTLASAADMVATMECHDADVYRCWEYTQYSAVFADGSIAENCVSAGLSLADVLPSLPGLPVMIIRLEHKSGPSEYIDHEAMQEETVTLLSIPDRPK